MEEEWWKRSRKVRINRSSRVWKRVSAIEDTTHDMGTSEDDENSTTNEITDENIENTTKEEDINEDSTGSEDEDSTVLSEDITSIDNILERDRNVSLVKRKMHKQKYEAADEEINEGDDETIHDEEDFIETNGTNVEHDYDRMTTDIGDEETFSDKDYEKGGELVNEVETDTVITVVNEYSSDKDEQIEDNIEINSVEEELNPDGDETSNPTDCDCISDNIDHTCEGNHAHDSRSARAQRREIIPEIINSDSEPPVTNHDEDEESDNENKDSSNEDSREYIRDNLLQCMNRSVSEPNYDYFFKDPFECLNSLLEEKQKRHTIVADSQISSQPSINGSEKEEEGEENSKSEEFKLEEETEESVSEQIEEQINTRALLKNATTYELEKFEKNALIIFNQENINGYKRRLGTRKDAEALATAFGNYGFEIEEHVDLVREDIFCELKKFSERDFTDYGCVAVAILTHGSDMGQLKARDRSFFEMDVVNFFKTQGRPTLVTKPKIVIIQACRGSRATQAVHVMRHGRISTDHEDLRLQHYTLPVEADMLVLHSTYVGNISHRDEIHGSWLIQTLCGKINELAPTHDLESIITEVKREVAIDKVHESYNRRTHGTDLNKQMPVVTSTLIRKLYLRKYECEVSEANGEVELSNEDVVEDAVVSQPGVEDAFTPCKCFLDRFEYLRDCMRYFVEENPDDETARSFLDVAEVLEAGAEFNVAKEKISRAIRNHLQSNAREFEYFKYLYLYKD